MKIVVLVKQVPDTETRLKSNGKSIDENGIKWITSPFDEHALEEALRQREKAGAEITALSLGPGRCTEALRNAYALGVDKAVHIKDDDYNVLDLSYTAAVLAKYLEGAEAQIIICGHIAIDSQSSMVPAMIAEHLGISNVNNAIELNIEGEKAKIRREIEGGQATMEAPLPVVLTAAKDLNEIRYPSLKGIMAAKKKQIESIDVGSLGVETERIEVLAIDPPPPRPPGRIIEGDSPEAKAKEVVQAMREEVKVI